MAMRRKSPEALAENELTFNDRLEEQAKRLLPNLAAEESRRSGAAPKKAIALAVFLFVFGTFLLSLGLLFYFHRIPVARKEDNPGLPLIILGSITFIPGIYHTRIAYYAYRGYAGYAYSDIPEYR